jgi:tetratricopeptide (TPR) repeat protein
MLRFLVRGGGIRIPINFHQHKPRRVVLLLDDVEARHARLFQTHTGVGERRLFKSLNALQLDMNMDMNNEHDATNMRKRGKAQAQGREKSKPRPAVTLFYSSHCAGFLNHVFNPMSRRPTKNARLGKAAAMPSGTPVAENSPALESGRRPAGLNDRWTVSGVCLFLVAITFAVFGQTLYHEFVYDDNDYVYENPEVARGLTFKGIVWAFSHVHSSNWHPLTWISHMLDCQLYGLSPGGHHLTNILLHTAAVILLFLVLRRMTGALWRSAFVAAVFAIHPLRVESVAWVAERKDVLSGVFFMLTIGAYVGYVSHPRSLVRYGLVMLLFALGLMCKPMLVTLPFVLLLLDYWPLVRVAGGGWRVTRFGVQVPQLSTLNHLLYEKLPLFGLAVASGMVTIFAQTKAIQSFEQISLPLRVGNALISYVAYLGQMFWPSGLAVLYPFAAMDVGVSGVVLSLVLLAGISAGAFVLRHRRYFLTGWLWYLIMLAPVIGILQVGSQARADRYTYLPQIGLYVLLTWAVADLCAGWRHRRVVLGGCATILLVALIFCARVQTAYWRNSESLWTHTLACTSDNAIAHNNLGVTLLQKGKVDEAIVHYQKALQINPDHVEAHIDFGNALIKKGSVDEAMVHYQKALQINPDSAKAHDNLGNALFKKGNVDEAIIHYQKALQIKPGSAETHYNLGNALLQKGNVDEAIVHYQMALQIKPDNTEAHNSLGGALLQKGKVDEAIPHFQKALQIKPDNAEACYNLGSALLQKGKVDEAIPHFQRALQIKPDNAEACYNLGNALLQKGRADEAITHYQKALQIKPNYLEVQNNLAWVLAVAPQALLRNGRQAVELALQANQLAGGENPIILRTLAAAYAEAGQFPEAVETAQRALQLAETQSNTALANAIRSQMKFYQAGSPFHSH